MPIWITVFQKQQKITTEISTYLELNGHYLDSMTVFDEAWQVYILSES